MKYSCSAAPAFPPIFPTITPLIIDAQGYEWLSRFFRNSPAVFPPSCTREKIRALLPINQYTGKFFRAKTKITEKNMIRKQSRSIHQEKAFPPLPSFCHIPQQGELLPAKKRKLRFHEHRRVFPRNNFRTDAFHFPFFQKARIFSSAYIREGEPTCRILFMLTWIASTPPLR